MLRPSNVILVERADHHRRAQHGTFGSLADFCRRTQLSQRPVEALILGGACDGWGRSRRRLLWELEDALQQATTGMTAAQHLTAAVAQVLREMDVTPVAGLLATQPGMRMRVGCVIAARQPPTVKGITFLVLEDATGIVNVVLKPAVVAKSRKALSAPFAIVEGQVQQRDGAVNVRRVCCRSIRRGELYLFRIIRACRLDGLGLPSIMKISENPCHPW